MAERADVKVEGFWGGEGGWLPRFGPWAGWRCLSVVGRG
jgi:hypothetical protein